MKAENVRIQMVSLNSAFINELDGILNKLTYFHRSVYYNRMQSIKIKTKSTPKALQNMHKTIYNVFKTESEILQSYFESLGLFDLVYYMDDVEYFFNEALHVWMRFEIGLSTLRNGGLSNNILYYIDNASKSINEDFLYNYYATSSRGKNFDVCARTQRSKTYNENFFLNSCVIMKELLGLNAIITIIFYKFSQKCINITLTKLKRQSYDNY
uniref:Uncharacterized protein n=1 Tax=Acrobeloides nanus TaxID=290746 RepID=A0A914E9E7_9BILA